MKSIAFPHGYPTSFHDGMTNVANQNYKVNYFLQKRIIDKKKDLMYSEGATVTPDKAKGLK